MFDSQVQLQGIRGLKILLYTVVIVAFQLIFPFTRNQFNIFIHQHSYSSLHIYLVL